MQLTGRPIHVFARAGEKGLAGIAPGKDFTSSSMDTISFNCTGAETQNQEVENTEIEGGSHKTFGNW